MRYRLVSLFSNKRGHHLADHIPTATRHWAAGAPCAPGTSCRLGWGDLDPADGARIHPFPSDGTRCRV